MRFRHFQLGAVRAVVNSRIQPWHRYHGFLTIIRERYEAEAKKYDPHPTPGVRVYRVTEDVRQRLQLEVETFYLFANMLLDQIAVNVRFFFGFPRNRKTKLRPHGEDWNHLTLLAKLAKDAAAMGLSGDVDAIISQADEFRRLRTYRLIDLAQCVVFFCLIGRDCIFVRRLGRITEPITYLKVFVRCPGWNHDG